MPNVVCLGPLAHEVNVTVPMCYVIGWAGKLARLTFLLLSEVFVHIAKDVAEVLVWGGVPRAICSQLGREHDSAAGKRCRNHPHLGEDCLREREWSGGIIQQVTPYLPVRLDYWVVELS